MQSTTRQAMQSVLVAVPEVHSFIERCMAKVGTPLSHATSLADNLTAADHRGHFSHGLNRLEMYIRDVRTGITVSDREPEVLKETVATAHVDGHNLLGPVVGKFCMDLAIEKAKEVGVGWVVARGSNHYGIAGWYAMRASSAGMVGMSSTNTSPLVIPTRGKRACMGTNPLSVAAPGQSGDSFVLDMATCTVALGKVEVKNVEGKPIPDGWGADNKGKMTNDPEAVLSDGGLLPLGGPEVGGGYKGYGLSMMAEVLCGIMGGATYGPNIRPWKATDKEANLGQCFIAVDPNVFASGFEGRMQDFMDTLRNEEPAEGETSVLVPGDPERSHIALCEKQGGIGYHPNVIDNLNRMAKELGVQPVTTVK